eukprot:57033-Amphidinium_carterae.1
MELPCIRSYSDLRLGLYSKRRTQRQPERQPAGSYLVGDSRESGLRRGHGIHTSPGRGSIGVVKARSLMHELEHVVLPQQRRLKQKQFGASDAR